MSWKTHAPTDPSLREPRVSRLIALELSSARQARVRIVVRNLSPHGLGARGECDILPCERVIVHMADGREIGATVRWVRKGTFGLSLDERIDLGVIKQSATASPGQIIPRDAEIGFQPFRHRATPNRSGFQRTHREEVLSHHSGWTSNRKDD